MRRPRVLPLAVSQVLRLTFDGSGVEGWRRGAVGRAPGWRRPPAWVGAGGRFGGVCRERAVRRHLAAAGRRDPRGASRTCRPTAPRRSRPGGPAGCVEKVPPDGTSPQQAGTTRGVRRERAVRRHLAAAGRDDPRGASRTCRPTAPGRSASAVRETAGEAPPGAPRGAGRPCWGGARTGRPAAGPARAGPAPPDRSPPGPAEQRRAVVVAAPGPGGTPRRRPAGDGRAAPIRVAVAAPLAPRANTPPPRGRQPGEIGAWVSVTPRKATTCGSS